MRLLSQEERSSFIGSRLASWRHGSHWWYSWGLARPGPECLYLPRTQFNPSPVWGVGLGGLSFIVSIVPSMSLMKLKIKGIYTVLYINIKMLFIDTQMGLSWILCLITTWTDKSYSQSAHGQMGCISVNTSARFLFFLSNFCDFYRKTQRFNRLGLIRCATGSCCSYRVLFIDQPQS